MLTESCEMLSGVGAAIQQKLARLHINTLSELLLHFPFRYQDRTHITPIQDIQKNNYVVIVGQIVKTELFLKRKKMLIVSVRDATGLLRLRFFHMHPSQVTKLREGQWIHAFGEIRAFSNMLEMMHPDYRLFEDPHQLFMEETLTPIYPVTDGLSQMRLRQLVKQTFALVEKELASLEWMNEKQRETYGFPVFKEALIDLHYPPPDTRLESFETGNWKALQRIAFDELLAKQLMLQVQKNARKKQKAPLFSKENAVSKALFTAFPFSLTGAQKRVIQEIAEDLEKPYPMLRLVQGDVGAGKTAIAAMAASFAIAKGYQVAIMAPTDLLSEQHASTFHAWFDPLHITVDRLSGKMKGREKKTIKENIQNGKLQIVIGTHALFQEDVHFHKLGLVIIDEQHRFGVMQRFQLVEKGTHADEHPHQLFLSATPIPRTLAMTLSQCLSLSILDELPPNRQKITTAVMSQDKRDIIIERLSAALKTGRQAYWICTLIDDSEKLSLQAATETAAFLKASLPDAKIGLVHGKMKPQEKERMMRSFKEGELHLLVATTVIEVGVDVPNASLMMIDNAERLGLSQLHQLRGRVGRGSVASSCVLLYGSPLSPDAYERLSILRETQDGFLIAEKDLKLRGSGDIPGTRQTGMPDYQVANIFRDAGLLPLVIQESKRLLKEAPHIAEKIMAHWTKNSLTGLQG